MSSAVRFRGGHPVPSPCLHACPRRSRVSLEPGHSCRARDSVCFHRRAFQRPVPPESRCRLEQTTSVSSRIEEAWGVSHCHQRAERDGATTVGHRLVTSATGHSCDGLRRGQTGGLQ